jgi:hypothetical protein
MFNLFQIVPENESTVAPEIIPRAVNMSIYLKAHENAACISVSLGA